MFVSATSRVVASGIASIGLPQAGRRVCQASTMQLAA